MPSNSTVPAQLKKPKIVIESRLSDQKRPPGAPAIGFFILFLDEFQVACWW